MFLLSSGLSRFIRRDSFRCNLNLNRKVFKTGVMTLQQNVEVSLISKVLYPQFSNLVKFTPYFIAALISLLLLKDFIMK